MSNKEKTKNAIMKRKKKGFTLIEVMVVLAIVAMLGVIVMPNLMSIRDNAKTKVDKQVCEGIKRTVLYLMADEVVSFSSASTSVSFQYNPTNKTITGEEGITSGKDELKAALQEVKEPQTNNSASYVINVTGNKTVKVQVGDSEISTEK